MRVRCVKNSRLSRHVHPTISASDPSSRKSPSHLTRHILYTPKITLRTSRTHRWDPWAIERHGTSSSLAPDPHSHFIIHSRPAPMRSDTMVSANHWFYKPNGTEKCLSKTCALASAFSARLRQKRKSVAAAAVVVPFPTELLCGSTTEYSRRIASLHRATTEPNQFPSPVVYALYAVRILIICVIPHTPNAPRRHTHIFAVRRLPHSIQQTCLRAQLAHYHHHHH